VLLENLCADCALGVPKRQPPHYGSRTVPAVTGAWPTPRRRAVLSPVGMGGW